jgi:hypothetical protein
MMDNRLSTTIATLSKLGRKTIPIKIIASTSLLIAFATVLNASMFCSPPPLLIAASILPTASARMNIEDERINYLLSSSSLSTSTSDDIRIAYSKIGVWSGSYQRVLYDSETNLLRLNNISTAVNDNAPGGLSLSQGQSQSQSNKQVSDSDQKNLQQMIEQNGFFQTNVIYPPPDTGVNENYDTLYVLSIEMDDRAHSVIWTDNSENVPAVILSIVKAIEKISPT